MNGIGGWFRELGRKLSMGLRSFMAGRYGTDKLNMVILVTSFLLVLASMFVRNVGVDLLLTGLAYGLMFWAVFRSLSRNTYRRYQENRKLLLLIGRVKDREHRYYTCPKCRQPVRVPRGKGKISITCPKCRERFIRKT